MHQVQVRTEVQFCQTQATVPPGLELDFTLLVSCQTRDELNIFS